MRDETDPLRDLGKQLPYDRPDPARRDAVRSSLLIAASEGQRPGARNRWLLVGGGFAAGALAAAAVAIIVLRSSTPVPAEQLTHTRIGESTDAKTLYDMHTPTSTGVTDRVKRVSAGTFRFEVPAGRKSEHVRVQTGDAEVEGSGKYEVVVAADMLASVTVAMGTATVRIKGQQAVFLAAGETWRPSVIAADLDIAPAKPVVVADLAAPAAVDPARSPFAVVPAPTAAAPAPSAVAARPTITRPSISAPIKTEAVKTQPAPIETEPAAINTAAPVEAERAPRPAVTAPVEPTLPVATGNSPTETSFRAGYALLREKDYSAAAVELGKAAGGDGPLAADARYFQAVALTKAGRGVDAERALVQFIDRAPTSVRRGRAIVMLARLLVVRGERVAARAWFEEALRDSDASVVAAARAGIAGL